VIRRLPPANGGWQGFCRITRKRLFFNTEYHITNESAKSMTKANVGEAPRSNATQRYPQLLEDVPAAAVWATNHPFPNPSQK